MMFRTVITVAAFLTFTSTAYADTINVSVDASTDDDVGRQIAFNLRQKIAASPLMTYVSDDKVGSIKARLITLNPDDDKTSQNYTVYSFVLVFHPKGDGLESYLTSLVGTCGKLKAAACADSMIAKIDEWGEIFRKTAAK